MNGPGGDAEAQGRRAGEGGAGATGRAGTQADGWFLTISKPGKQERKELTQKRDTISMITCRSPLRLQSTKTTSLLGGHLEADQPC